MSRATRCPSCGEHVSPFAAGCAICGAPLDPRRARHGSVGRRIRSAWLARPRLLPRIPLPRWLDRR